MTSQTLTYPELQQWADTTGVPIERDASRHHASLTLGGVVFIAVIPREVAS